MDGEDTVILSDEDRARVLEELPEDLLSDDEDED